MSQDLGSSRRYSEKEISAIFQRALERQEADRSFRSPDVSSGQGLSLQELEQIAAEVGLDPRHIRAAAADLEQERDQRFYLVGGPQRVVLERLVEGEVSEEAWEEMTAELRRSLGSGQARESGSSREWTLSQGFEPIQVTVTSREGQTRLQLTAQWPGSFMGFFGPALLVWIFFAGFFGSFAPVIPLLKVLVCVGAFGGLFALARLLFGRSVRRRQRQLAALLDRLEALVAKSEEAAPAKPRLTREESEDQVLFQRGLSSRSR